MLISKWTKDLIWTEMRLVEKIHSKYFEILGWKRCSAGQPSEKDKWQWDTTSRCWVGELRSLDHTSVSTWGSNIFLLRKITNFIASSFGSDQRHKCLPWGRSAHWFGRKGEQIIGIMSCFCHSLSMWSPAAPGCSPWSRGKTQSPFQSRTQLSPVPLDKLHLQ